MPAPASIPTKPEIQALKSIRDDLVRRFKETDDLMRSLQASLPTGYSQRPAYRLAKKHGEKWTRQIVALSVTIKYLNETTSKQ